MISRIDRQRSSSTSISVIRISALARFSSFRKTVSEVRKSYMFSTWSRHLGALELPEARVEDLEQRLIPRREDRVHDLVWR